MPYSEFTLKKVKNEFDLQIIENKTIFNNINAVDIDSDFKNKLEENIHLALAINTEKARSEFIIAYVLSEIKYQLKDRISLFSGVDFDVDKEKNLNGFCDFIISLSSEQFYITAPVITVVEAKNENIVAGIGQCLSEMVASQQFNDREHNSLGKIYGAITTGNAWKFMKLENKCVYIDRKEYHIENIEKIMGILLAMIDQLA